MVEASKLAVSNSNASRSWASNINKQSTPGTKKKEYSRQWQDNSNASNICYRGRRQIAAHPQEKGLLATPPWVLDAMEDDGDGTQLERAMPPPEGQPLLST